MGMILVVADRILSVFDIDGLVRHHLDALSVQDALVIVGQHVGDEGLVGIEIVPDFLHHIIVLSLLHLRLAFPFTTEGVQRAAGIDDARGHVIFHIIGGQGHVLVLNLHAAVVIDHAFPIGKILYDGIAGGSENRYCDGALGKHLERVGRRHGITGMPGLSCKIQGVKSRLLRRIHDGFGDIPALSGCLASGATPILGKRGHAGQQNEDQRDKYGF